MHLKRSKGPIAENFELDVHFVIADPIDSQNITEIAPVVAALRNWAWWWCGRLRQRIAMSEVV